MIIRNLKAACLVLLVLSLNSCKKDPVIPNEEELITTLIVELTAPDSAGPITLRFEDLDGDGGSDPTITGGTLSVDTEYETTITLSNDSVTPSEDITGEIEEEAEEHQFFFQSDIGGVSFSYNDEDANGNPIGLSSKVSTSQAGTGSITITLRHEPNKSGTGVADGDISNAGGETDIEVIFPIDVQQ